MEVGVRNGSSIVFTVGMALVDGSGIGCGTEWNVS